LLKNKDEKLDPRVIRTRALIVQAFMDLMQTRDFSQLTVQDLSDHAMINRATFYAHFNDKYDLFQYATRAWFQEHLDKSMPTADSFTVENVRALTASTYSFLGGFIGHCSPANRHQDLPFEKHIQGYLYEILLDWIQAVDPALLPENAIPETIATALSWAIFGSAINWAQGSQKTTAEQEVEQLLTMITSGIFTPLSG